MNVCIALDVPEEHSYIAMVRRIARVVLEQYDHAVPDIDDFEAVLGELCANVTHHAHSERGCYRVTLEHHGDHVVLVVADQGQGFDQQGLAAVGEQRQDMDGTMRHGGFGLHLVRTLSDHVEIGPSFPQGTTVRAEKHFACDGPVPAK